MVRFLFIVFSVFIQSLASAQTDFEIAQSFMAVKGVTLLDDGGSANRASANLPYSVFHSVDGNGFAIVKDGVVVGYSTDGSIDEANMPPALSQMLLYTDASGWQPTGCEPVEPLIKMIWDQGNRYIHDAPSGCTNVAMSMILHYWKYPKTFKKFDGADGEFRGKKYHLEPLDEYHPDYDAMAVRIDCTNKDNKASALAEELIMQVGYRNITVYAHGGSCIIDPPNEALVNRWGYKYIFDGCVGAFGVVQNYMLGAHGDQFYEYVHRHTKQGHPLLVVGQNENNACHAYIIDGMDSDGRYHVNYGWGGPGNGYYVYGRRGVEYDGDGNGYEQFPLYMCARAIIPDDDEYVEQFLSGITTVSDVRKDDGYVYSISGQRMGSSLEGLPSGIYIRGGLKYVVR